MKNRFVAPVLLGTALACTAGASFAQSSVTLYGVADVYLNVGKGANGTQYLLQSGGMSGSRLGFRGSEDLGGGLKAIFQIESGIAMDTGTITQGGVMWGRQAFVGISSAAAGTVTLGRQYNPAFLTIDAFDPFGTGFGSVANTGIMTLHQVRINNSLVYASPTIYGLQVKALGALGEGPVATATAAGSRTLDVDVSYAAGPLAAAVNYYKKNDINFTQVDAQILLGAASYDFGVVKVMGAYQRVKNPTQARRVRDDRDEYFVGIQAPVGPGKVSLGGGQGKTRDVGGTKATQFSGGYDYFLSKRTDLYVVGTYIDNAINSSNPLSPVVTAVGATGGGVNAIRDTTVKSLAIGVRHRF